VPLAQVRDLLGHASITTTERYDNQKLENLQAAAAKLEAGKLFTPPPAANAKPASPAKARKKKSPRVGDEASVMRGGEQSAGGLVLPFGSATKRGTSGGEHEPMRSPPRQRHPTMAELFVEFLSRMAAGSPFRRVGASPWDRA